MLCGSQQRTVQAHCCCLLVCHCLMRRIVLSAIENKTAPKTASTRVWVFEKSRTVFHSTQALRKHWKENESSPALAAIELLPPGCARSAPALVPPATKQRTHQASGGVPGLARSSWGGSVIRKITTASYHWGAASFVL